MKVGCSIENGWYGLLESLCEALDDPKFGPIDLKLAQVKQKFGVMTVYLDSDKDGRSGENKGLFKDANHLVSEFTAKSVKICEKCSSTHLVKTQPIGLYVCTLCNKCATFAATHSLSAMLEFAFKDK